MATATSFNKRGVLLKAVLAGFPLAFYTGSAVSFITYAANGNNFWFRAGFVATLAGLVMDVIAAIPSIRDWQNLAPRSEERQMASTFVSLNTLAIVLFALNGWIQYAKLDLTYPTVTSAVTLSLLGWASLVIGMMYGGNLLLGEWTSGKGVASSPGSRAEIPTSRPRAS